ncbi:hypothetical protein PG990_008173 [Apiospora arundinis]|uniref:F-box domain-containing protein n=1 Tax=Apiospora arundinis TaxID=335852 RepID=A0ABR2JLL3_9PEZI
MDTTTCVKSTRRAALAIIEQLPDELLVIIAQECGDHKSIARLARVSHRLHAVASDVLYGNIIKNQEWQSIMFWAAGNSGVATLRNLASLSSGFIQSHTAKRPNQSGENKKIIQARFRWINLDDFDAKQQD